MRMKLDTFQYNCPLCGGEIDYRPEIHADLDSQLENHLVMYHNAAVSLAAEVAENLLLQFPAPESM